MPFGRKAINFDFDFDFEPKSTVTPKLCICQIGVPGPQFLGDLNRSIPFLKSNRGILLPKQESSIYNNNNNNVLL